MLSTKRRKILEKAKEQGGISGEEAREIYDSKSSAYESLNKLTELGMLKKNEAPESSNNRFIWMVTELGKRLVS